MEMLSIILCPEEIAIKNIIRQIIISVILRLSFWEDVFCVLLTYCRKF